MADAVGDIYNDQLLGTDVLKSKTNTLVTLGDVLVFDTDGLAPAANASAAGLKVFIALETVAAVGGTRNDIKVGTHGHFRARKITGAGSALIAGEMPEFGVAAFDGNQANKAGSCTVTLDAADGDAFVEVFID